MTYKKQQETHFFNLQPKRITSFFNKNKRRKLEFTNIIQSLKANKINFKMPQKDKNPSKPHPLIDNRFLARVNQLLLTPNSIKMGILSLNSGSASTKSRQSLILILHSAKASFTRNKNQTKLRLK